MKKVLGLITGAGFIFRVTSCCLITYEVCRGIIAKIICDKVSVKNGRIIRGSGRTSLGTTQSTVLQAAIVMSKCQNPLDIRVSHPLSFNHYTFNRTNYI